MNERDSKIAEQLAIVAGRLQEQRTGHAPKAVAVVLSEDTLVVTLHEALTPAEAALARTTEGAAKVQEFHRELFASSNQEMRQEIERLTGRKVREAAAEIETTTGTVVLAFTTGSMVQVFLLTPCPVPDPVAFSDAEKQMERAEDDGLPSVPENSGDVPENCK